MKKPSAYEKTFFLALMLGLWLSLGALTVGLISPSGFALTDSGSTYSLNIAEAGGGSASNSNYKIEVYTEPAQGEASGSGYILSVGSRDYFEEPPAPEFSDVGQSSATPKSGETVNVSASVSSDTGLSQLIFYVDDGTGFKEYDKKNVSGNNVNTSFSWKGDLPSGTAVNWKIVAIDSLGRTTETSTGTFTTDAVDLEAPKIISLSVSPEKPAVGENLRFSAEISDDFGLASATLEFGGKNVSLKTLVGKKATAEFLYSPEAKAGQQVEWKIFVRDSSGKGAVSEIKKLTFLSKPTVACKDSEKPKLSEEVCVDGKKKIHSVKCNTSIGKWEITSKEIECLSEQKQKENTVLVMIGIIFIIIVVSAAYYYKENPQAFKDALEKIRKKINEIFSKPAAKS